MRELFNLTDIKYILSEFDGVNKPSAAEYVRFLLNMFHTKGRCAPIALAIILQLWLESCGWRALLSS